MRCFFCCGRTALSVVVVARVRNLVARVFAARVSGIISKTLVLEKRSALVLIGRMYRRRSCSTDDWLEKERVFDAKEGERIRKNFL